jgi:MFS-type transporter involved in bile tolerance (Atg22 family)
VYYISGKKHSIACYQRSGGKDENSNWVGALFTGREIAGIQPYCRSLHEEIAPMFSPEAEASNPSNIPIQSLGS